MFALIDFLESFLPQFEGEVDVMFGWAWAMEFYNWEERTMPITMVRGEVQSAESQDFGSLGDDDLYVRVKSHDLEIHFCHEGDLHISFDAVGNMVEGILEYLFRSYSTIAVEKHGNVPRVFAFGLPIFLCGVTFTNETETAKDVWLLPWNEKLPLEPGAKLRVTGYSQSPGLLKVDQNDDSYIAVGWPECDVRAMSESKVVFDSALG